MIILSSDLFQWHHEPRVFVGRWTDLSLEQVSSLISATEFTMVSSRSGSEILCLLAGWSHDRRGREIFSRWLCKDQRHDCLQGGLAGAEVRIFA